MKTKSVTGYIHKRGKVFHLQYTVRGKRFKQSLGTANRAEAERKAEQIIAPHRAADEAESMAAIAARLERTETAAADLGPGVKISEAWKTYLDSETRPQSGLQTLRQYEGHFTAFTEYMKANHKGIVNLRDVTEKQAAGFVRHLTAIKLSGARINKHTSFLKTFFRVLAPAARMKSNPFEGIARRNHTTESRRPFTIGQLKTIIEKATGEMQTLLMIGTFTGLRFGDCSTLLWDEVDLTRGMIRRVPSKTKRKGEPVIVAMPEVLTRHLGDIKRSGPFVLPDCASTYTSRPEILSRKIQAHLELCGIETVKPGTGGDTGARAVCVYGFHSLRHTYITLAAQSGTPQAILMKMAGHGSPIISQLYTHLDEGTARRTAAALPAVLDEPETKREPLPKWAVKIIRKMNTRNLAKWKAELLKGAV